LRQEILELLAVVEALAELHRLVAELFVGERGKRRTELVDLGDQRLHALDLTLVPGPDDLPDDGLQHESTVITQSSGCRKAGPGNRWQPAGGSGRLLRSPSR